QIPLDRSALPALAFSLDGTRVAVGDYGPGASPQGSTAGVRVVPVPSHTHGSREIRPTNALLPFHTLAFFPDSRRLAGADRDGVHLWNLDDAVPSRFLPEFGVWEVSISPDGRHLATA